MFRSPFVWLVLALAAPSAAQDPAAPSPKVDAPKVEVPTFPNPTCPIMGKKVSMPLFVDTELGRFYVCCKPCYKKVLADVPAAHKTAYPTVQTVANTTCPRSGEPIGEHAVEVTLQGYRFKLCCEGCVAGARQHAQVTLAKVARPQLEDVGNSTCPVSGQPTAANAFAVVGDALVHLAAPSHADAVAKDPVAMLTKARTIAQAQPKPAKHVHQPATKDAPKDAAKEPAKPGPAKERP